MNRMPSKSDLYTAYITERKPMWKIADEMGVSVGSVYNYIKKYGIESRKIHDYPATDLQRNAWKKIGASKKGTKMSEEARVKISEAKEKGGIGHKKKRMDGYVSVYFPDHPRSNSDGYIMEHILVMEAIVGRHLSEDECVHHINGKRDDNRAKNLKLMTKKEHMSYHMKERWKTKKEE